MAGRFGRLPAFQAGDERGPVRCLERADHILRSQRTTHDAGCQGTRGRRTARRTYGSAGGAARQVHRESARAGRSSFRQTNAAQLGTRGLRSDHALAGGGRTDAAHRPAIGQIACLVLGPVGPAQGATSRRRFQSAADCQRGPPRRTPDQLRAGSLEKQMVARIRGDAACPCGRSQ